MTLDLNQIVVETFDVSTPEACIAPYRLDRPGAALRRPDGGLLLIPIRA
jgi:hypothetical protein